MNDTPQRRSARPRRPRVTRLRWWGIAAVLVVVAVAATVGVARRSASRPQTPQLAVGALAPDGQFTTVNRQTTTIAALRGQPTLVWFVATFCDSCQAGTEVMAQQIDQFARHHVKVVELELAGNLGGGGPDIATFGRQFAGKNSTHPAWLWGTASPALTATYDPKSYLDAYYLLDANGHIVYVNASPGSTMDALLAQVRTLGT